MKSGLPALLAIVALVASAFWFDAHNEQLADAASTWMTPASASNTTAASTDDTTGTTSTESTVAFSSTNESE